MKKNVLATIVGILMIFSVFEGFSARAASTVDTSIPGGTAVIGDKAISLTYANDSVHTDEINALIVNSTGSIYVKDFNDEWIDNNSGKVVDSSVISAKTYTDDSGKVTDLNGSTDNTGDFQVTSIE